MNDPYVSRNSAGGYMAKRSLPSEGLLALNMVDLVPLWVADALCAQTDPEAFYPEKGGSTKQAKAICAQCSTSTACLQYALDNGERFGIWGGLSERERRKLRPEVFAAQTLSHDEQVRDEVRSLTELGLSPKAIAEQIGCHTDTVRRIKRELIPSDERR